MGEGGASFNCFDAFARSSIKFARNFSSSALLIVGCHTYDVSNSRMFHPRRRVESQLLINSE